MVLFSSTQVMGQENNVEGENIKHNNNIIKFSPFHFFAKTLLLSYERMCKKSGFTITAGYTYSNKVDNEKLEGGNLEVQYRYYALEHNIKKNINNKYYFAPYIGDSYMDKTQYTYDYLTNGQIQVQKYQINAISAGVIMGIDIAIYNKINFDIFFGGGLRRTNNNNYQNDNNSIFDIGYNGIIPKIGFQAGVIF
jgi:hypothetical protein